MVIPGGVASRVLYRIRKASLMSDALTLPAEARERAGKGASRVLRREGRVPAVIYGGKEEPTPIHVEAKELVRQLGTGHFMNSIVMIDISEVTLPAGSESAITDRDFTIATLVAPSALKKAEGHEANEGETAEGEDAAGE
jgi:ribosomal protein L25 (general stress protein Ctc)